MSTMKWELSELVYSVKILDLIISIENQQIKINEFEKELNPHQYIAPHSVLPRSTLKGLIIGTIQRYYVQNTSNNHFEKTTAECHKHLHRVGYDRAQINPFFHKASKYLLSINNAETLT